MGCYRRKVKRGIRWRFVGSYLGTRYSSKAIYLTKNEALRAERVVIKELDQNARKVTVEPNLTEFLNIRLDYAKTKSLFYYKENKKYLKMLSDRVGDIPVSKVSKLEISNLINAYAQDLKNRGKTQHKTNTMLRLIKAAFYYGINLYDLPIRNPAVGIKFNAIDKRLKYIPSDADIKAVINISNPEQKLLVQFVMDTGCRIFEALRFTDNDCLSDHIVLYTRKAKNSDLTPRKLPKPECIKSLTFKGRLFNYNSYPRFLEEKVRLLGQKPWNWHNLRHRYASRLSKEGRPLFEIMNLLGHANLSTTQGYLQLL